MPPAIIVSLINFGLEYGPEAVKGIIDVLNNPAATVADVQKAFSNLKPYSAYGIPDVAPTSPVVPVTSTLPTVQ